MTVNPKPFLKWAGGKTQLISEIEKTLPRSVVDKRFVYIEPFVGSGAVLFWLLNNFPTLEKAVINDINEDLINTYDTIKHAPGDLISILEILQDEYHALDGRDDKKKEYYYHKRALFNGRRQGRTEHSALFIFLNRTCFNGLYRVNRRNEFNVPIGNYKKPSICDRSNLLAVSEALQKVDLLCGDFEQTAGYAGPNTLFYFDPPYKPLSETSSFNSYAKYEFNDGEQIRLKNFCDSLHAAGHNWLLSNSDVKGVNADDNFFDDLYADFTIKRVTAKRSINANPEKRGFLTELLIANSGIAVNDINRFQMPLIRQKYKLIATDRTAIRREVTELFLAEPAGTGKGHLTSRAEYTVECILNGEYKITLKRPAGLNKGFDFTVNVGGLYFKAEGNRSTPSHEDIITSLKSARHISPEKYPDIEAAIDDIYNCKFYDGTPLTGVQFADYSGNRHPVEIILLAIKWLFIEQDITYWNWSGRNMFMNVLKDNGLA